MNEITRIRIAKTAYDIDLDAKRTLDKYSHEVQKSLGNDSDVYDDIEIRMTEILAERGVNRDDVITIADVNAIKSQLGQPGDFSDDDDKQHQDRTEYTANAKPPRKYYRDEDNALVGGVIAGLSAYTGWDVTLLRLLFVATCLCSFSVAFWAYLIAWIVAPAARTTSEKMEMRGEPVNLDSLKQTAKEFSDDAKNAVQKVGDKAQSLKGSSGRNLGQILISII